MRSNEFILIEDKFLVLFFSSQGKKKENECIKDKHAIKFHSNNTNKVKETNGNTPNE